MRTHGIIETIKQIFDTPVTIYCLVAAAIVILILTVYVTVRPYRYLLKRRPPYIASFDLAGMTFDHLQNNLGAFANQNGYKLLCVSQEDQCVILSDGISGLSWGFFYPIYLSPDGKNVITGIKSKFFQDQDINPVRQHKFKRILGGLQKVFGSTASLQKAGFEECLF